MKILFVPYGTEKAPATRYRVSQYLPYLESKGIECVVFSAISRFLTGLMIKSPNFSAFCKFIYYVYVLAERFVRLLWVAIVAKSFDTIYIQRSTFPAKLEMALRLANKNIVFDIDDAIFLPDSESKDALTRLKSYMKKSEVISILKVSRAVIVENEYIKQFVSRYCSNVFKIPGPIDTKRYFVKKDKEHRERKVTIGWIGSPATTPYLHILDNVFKRIAEKYNFVNYRFIGLGKYENPHIKFEKIEWDYDTEISELQKFDIGIMPMPDSEWTRGKLGCKMLQYMAVGIPAVVSYTPTNAEIIQNGTNGFFATSDKEWTQNLSALVEDESLRMRIGEAGRKTVEDKCSLARNVSVLIGIFTEQKPSNK